MNENGKRVIKSPVNSSSSSKKKKTKIMEVDEKKSNFSSINPTNGAVLRGGSSGNTNAKGDIKKIVIKNFKSKFSLAKYS